MATYANDEDIAQCNPKLNNACQNTCKVLFGKEIGELMEFREYLKRYTDPIEKRKSVLSGKEVTISSKRIPKNAVVIGYEEVEVYENKTAGMQLDVRKFHEFTDSCDRIAGHLDVRKFQDLRTASGRRPLDINNIKDIDSIIETLGEKACYAGNIVLGNSGHIQSSHRCINTFYAMECQDVYDGKYVAFTTSIRSPEYSFGCCFGGEIQFCIKVLDPHKQMRCFETFHCNVVTDSYYSASLEDCSNCLFSFNQRNKHYLIGNVPLARDKYAALKSKLTKEIADDLERKKSLPSVIEIISGKGEWNG